MTQLELIKKDAQNDIAFHETNGDRTLTATMTKELADEEGEVLVVSGCDTEYNDLLDGLGVIMYHEKEKIPVGKIRRLLPRPNRPVPDVLLSMYIDTGDIAEDAYRLIKAGILHISHGFVRNAYAPATAAEKAKWPGAEIVTTDWRPYEVTLTPIPCNAHAQFEKGFKSLETMYSKGQIRNTTYRMVADQLQAKSIEWREPAAKSLVWREPARLTWKDRV